MGSTQNHKKMFGRKNHLIKIKIFPKKTMFSAIEVKSK
jgi:hypothetical protein